MPPPDWDQAILARACSESWILVAPDDRALALQAIARGGAVIGTAMRPGVATAGGGTDWPGRWCEVWCFYGPRDGPWAPEPARLVTGATPAAMEAVAAALDQEHILLDTGGGWHLLVAERDERDAVVGYRQLGRAQPLPVDGEGKPLKGSP